MRAVPGSAILAPAMARDREPTTDVPSEPTRYRLKDLELDLARWELFDRVGRSVPLQPKALSVLVHLVRNRDRAVPKEELLRVLWDDVTVTPHVLTRAIWLVREVFREHGFAQDPIQTVPRRGYRFAAEVEVLGEETGSAVDARGGQTERGVFGREDERRRFVAILDRTVRGAGQLVWIEGDPGIGKTRLLECLRDDARERSGIRVHGAACIADEGAPPSWPLSMLVRELLDALDPEARARVLVGLGEDLAPLIPEVLDPSEVRPERSLTPAQARFRQLDAIATFFVREARRAPLVLTLDDVHRADEEVFGVLELLVPRLSAVPLTVCVASRSSGFRARQAQKTRAALLAHPSVAHVPLGALEWSAITALVRAHCPRLDDRHVADAAASSGGNPLFGKELGVLLESEGGRTRASPTQVPEKVREAITRRWAESSEIVRRVLGIASLVGSRVDVALLQELDGLSTPDRIDALEEAVRARFLVAEPNASGVFSWSHDLVRESVRQSLPTAERAAMHRAIGDTLRRRALPADATSSAEIAYHYGEAAPLGAHAEAITYSRRAAERARRSLAYEDAALHLQRANELLARFCPEAWPTRVEVSLELGQNKRDAGRPAEEVRATYRDAAMLARAIPDPALFARAAVGYSGPWGTGEPYVGWIAGIDPERVSLLEDARRDLASLEPSLGALVTIQLAEALLHAADDARRARLADEALALAERSGDPAVIAAVLCARFPMHFGRLQPTEERLAMATRVVEIAQRLRSPSIEMEGRAHRAATFLEAGRLREADEEMGLVAQVAHAFRIPEPYEGMYRVMRLALEGRLSEAEESASRYKSELSGMYAGAEVALGIQLLRIRILRGTESEGMPSLERRVETLPYAFRAGRARVMAWLGQSAEAHRELDLLAGRNFEDIPSDVARPKILVDLAHLVADLGDVARAEVIFEMLKPHADRIVFSALFAFCEGSARFPLARLSALLGREEEALAYYEGATEHHRRVGAALMQAFADLEHARVLASHQTGAARELAARSLSAAEAMGVPRLIAQARALLAQLR